MTCTPQFVAAGFGCGGQAVSAPGSNAGRIPPVFLESFAMPDSFSRHGQRSRSPDRRSWPSALLNSTLIVLLTYAQIRVFFYDLLQQCLHLFHRIYGRLAPVKEGAVRPRFIPAGSAGFLVTAGQSGWRPPPRTAACRRAAPLPVAPENSGAPPGGFRQSVL